MLGLTRTDQTKVGIWIEFGALLIGNTLTRDLVGEYKMVSDVYLMVNGIFVLENL